MKPTKIIIITALLTLFICCANTSMKKTAEVTKESPSTSAVSEDNDNTPTDVRSFGLLGKVKEVRLSLREYTPGSEDDAWESLDSLNMAFDKNGRVVRDFFENIYQYDDKGNFTKGVSEKSKMERDEKGRIVLYENWMDDEDDQGFTIKFVYDNKGRMSKVEFGGWEHTIDHSFTYTGDNIYPDRINLESEDEGDHYSTVITYTYKKFDDKGNWTEREAHSLAKHTTEDDPTGDTTELKRVETRTIKYYD